jgi:hypothetical protein
MAGENERPEQESKWRRFRVGRKVKPNPVETDHEKALRELEEEDDADRGTPEMDRSVRKGCTGCLYVSGLIVALFFLTILGNCARGN